MKAGVKNPKPVWTPADLVPHRGTVGHVHVDGVCVCGDKR